MTELDVTADDEAEDFTDELVDEALDREPAGGKVTGYRATVGNWPVCFRRT